MKNKLLSISVAAIACLTACSFLSQDTFAEASGLNVYILGEQPKHIEEYIKPGETYRSTIDVQNNNDEVATITLTPKPLSYSPLENDYVPDYHSETDRTQLAKWIVFPDGDEYDIEPGETINIEYEFTVPKNAISGTQATAILVHAVTDEERNSASGIAAEISFGYTIFANIDGADLKEEGHIVSWEAMGFTFAPPVRASTIIENTGNISFTAKHVFEVYSLFTDKDPIFTDDQDLDVLPESKRALYQYWHEAPLLGAFSIKETVSFLGDDFEYGKVVIVCPLWFILLVSAFLISIIVLIAHRSRARKQQKLASSDK